MTWSVGFACGRRTSNVITEFKNYLTRDGASQSGLLVTSVCIWERMKDELEVDVFETTKRLKSIRPQIINNLVCFHSTNSIVAVAPHADNSYL